MSTYTEAYHRQAYEAWCETRSVARAAARLDCSYQTALKWSRPDYECQFGCPWHGWEELANKELQDQLRKGVTVAPDAEQLRVQDADLATDLVIPEKLRSPTKDRRRDLNQAAIRADIQKIYDLEYIYRKLFWEITGVALEFDELVEYQGIPVRDREALEAVYRQGKRAQTQEGAIRALRDISREIRELRRSAGLDRLPPQPAAAGKEEDDGEMTLEKARQIQQMLENTSVEKLDVIRQYMESEAQALEKRPDGEE